MRVKFVQSNFENIHKKQNYLKEPAFRIKKKNSVQKQKYFIIYKNFKSFICKNLFKKNKKTFLSNYNSLSNLIQYFIAHNNFKR